MIYNLCKRLVAKYKKAGNIKALEGMREKLDVYYAADRLTDEEYTELMALT